MKHYVRCTLGILAMMGMICIEATSANADTEIGIAKGRTCGPNRDGHPIHMKYSEDESMCVYLSANEGATNCTKESCCPKITTAPKGGSTQLWDAKNHVCKQGAGTTHLSCPAGSALVSLKDNGYVSSLPQGNADTVGYDPAPDGTPSWQGGQVCVVGVTYSGGHVTSCAQAGAGYVAPNTPGVNNVPGYQASFGCVGTYKPTGVDVPDPGLQ